PGSRRALADVPEPGVPVEPGKVHLAREYPQPPCDVPAEPPELVARRAIDRRATAHPDELDRSVRGEERRADDRPPVGPAREVRDPQPSDRTEVVPPEVAEVLALRHRRRRRRRGGDDDRARGYEQRRERHPSGDRSGDRARRSRTGFHEAQPGSLGPDHVATRRQRWLQRLAARRAAPDAATGDGDHQVASLPVTDVRRADPRSRRDVSNDTPAMIL